jgi:translation initiation factor IF-1
MANYPRLWKLAVLTVCAIGAASVADAASELQGTYSQLLAGDRVLLGTVEDVASDQARINTGEVQPRFIPMNVRKAKGLLDLKKGDRIELTVNDQNLLVDVHLLGEASHHRIVQGQLAESLETGHDKAVIRNTTGKEESHFIRPLARSKVASIPVGVDAAFLIDELDKIVDVVFGNKEAVHRAADLWQKKTPLKGNLSQIRGVISKPLEDNTIAIRTENGNEQPYEVRPLIQQRLAHISKGDAVVLLVDEENKVTDVAFVPSEK